MEQIYRFEQKGYILEQSNYNWHYRILEAETGRCVMHSSCTRELTEPEAKKAIDSFLDLQERITDIQTNTVELEEHELMEI